MQRYTVHFAGRVQGVGFRYRVERIAQRHAVAGYVQNLPDGRVRLVAEGELTVLDAYIADVKQAMQRYIHNVDVSRDEATGEFGPVVPGALVTRH